MKYPKRFVPPVGSAVVLLFSILAFFISLMTPQELAVGVEGTAKVDFLLKNLESASDYKVRLAAASALGKVADGTVADWMLRAFRAEENDAVRLATIYAVGQIPDHRIVSPLLELVREEILAKKEMLAVERILWNFRSAIIVPAWAAAVESAPDRSDRAMAAWLLGVVGDRSIVPVMATASKDGSPLVRLRAVQALGKLGAAEGKPFCSRVQKHDSDDTVRKASAICVSAIDLRRAGKVPQDEMHQVDLRIDLFGLEPSSVKPETFAEYQKRNVNPRALDVAVGALRPSQEEDRKDRSVRLVIDERLRETFKLDVTLITTYRFRTADLNRLREIVRDRAGSVNECYVKVVRTNRKLQGNVVAEFRVMANGAVGQAKITGGSLANLELHMCMIERIKSIQFIPIPIDFVTMKYTFSFTPPKDEKFEF